jgi:hypothetical protein
MSEARNKRRIEIKKLRKQKIPLHKTQPPLSTLPQISPCKLCGGEAKLISNETGRGHGYVDYEHFVKCTQCSASSIRFSDWDKDDKLKAIEEWNKIMAIIKR